MSSPAGIFQVQEILAPKVLAGPLAGAVDVIAVTDGSNGETKEIISGIRMQGAKFVPYDRSATASGAGQKKIKRRH